MRFHLHFPQNAIDQVFRFPHPNVEQSTSGVGGQSALDLLFDQEFAFDVGFVQTAVFLEGPAPGAPFDGD